MGLVRTLGLRKEDLVPFIMSFNTVVDAEMLILGALFIEIVGKAETEELYISQQMCYIAKRHTTTTALRSYCRKHRAVGGSYQEPLQVQRV